jgi:OOP family OmpA-OmpF porin
VLDAADKCPNTPQGAAVNADGCPLDSDGDGVLDVTDKCPNTPAGVSVNAEGCPLDGDGDGVPDAGDACPNTSAGTKVDARGCPVIFGTDNSFTLTGVTFETSSAVIRPSSFAKLDEVAEALNGNPEVRVEISGHTDNVGSEESNQRLSLARAQAVRQYFIDKGVAADRLEARGFGESRPITTNETPEGRAENRRVEMSRLP